MNDQPLLSVCIPTYGRLSYLKELLSAVLSQVDALPAGSVEVCVSDNASPDGTKNYLASLSSSALRFWTNPTNIGGDRNFLKCIAEAHGEYVWLLGDDELLPEGAVARVVAALARHRPGLLISGEGPDVRLYEGYAEVLAERRVSFPLEHTLISANVFKRSLFDLPYAETKLKLSYAHMFGMMCDLDGEKVVVVPNFVTVRPVRVAFEKFPTFLCVKQAIYLWWLVRKFGLPLRFRLYAVRTAVNLPIEYAARIKGWMVRKGWIR